MPRRAEIIAIGSELVSGQGLDTNSQWLSRELGSVGISVAFHTTIGDELDDHVSAFRIAADRAGLVIMTGGLGPTQDDLTREALAALAGVPLREDPASLEAIAAMFARRNRPMAERNKVQALFPEGAEPLPNRVGTAPGIWMELGATTFACLPGIPSEMRVMFQEQVLPRMQRAGLDQPDHRPSQDQPVRPGRVGHRGRGDGPDGPRIASPRSASRPTTRRSASGSAARARTEEEALRQTEPTAALIHERFGDLVLGEGSTDVPEAVSPARPHRRDPGHRRVVHRRPDRPPDHEPSPE